MSKKQLRQKTEKLYSNFDGIPDGHGMDDMTGYTTLRRNDNTFSIVLIFGYDKSKNPKKSKPLKVKERAIKNRVEEILDDWIDSVRFKGGEDLFDDEVVATEQPTEKESEDETGEW